MGALGRLDPMKRRRTIYEGKAKILYEGPEPGTLVQYFKDDTTAFDAKKKAVLEGKGVLNNRISEYLMTPPAPCRRASAFRKASRCRAPSSSIITRTMRCTIRGFRKSTSPRSAGRARRTSTTSSI